MERNFILIVDDEPTVRSRLARLLQEEGYETLLAESAEDGLAILEKRSFSAVISDYRMPGRSGIDFLTEVKNRRPESVRILLTDPAEIAEVMPSVEKGLISHLLIKPWDNETLIKTLARSIEAFERAHPGRAALLGEKPSDETIDPAKIDPEISLLDETEEGVIIIEE